MDTALSLKQLSEVIERHRATFAHVTSQPTITIDHLAYAVSKLAVDPDVARDVVATSTGQPLCDVAGGFATLLRASIISGQTMAAHPPEKIANIFIGMAVTGFGSEVGGLQ
jgi:hypothetical protein